MVNDKKCSRDYNVMDVPLYTKPKTNELDKKTK